LIKFKKGFTLIELLVVVAIIGILAAVGVLGFNNYVGQAKISTIKSNHSIVLKKLNLFIHQCTINSKVKLMRENNDKKVYEMDCYYDMNPWWLYGVYFKNDLNNSIQWKNPYLTTIMGSENFVAQNGSCYGAFMDDYVGFVHIYSLTALNTYDRRVSVCACFKTPCSNPENRIESYVNF